MANTAGETDDGDGWDSDGLGYHTPGDDEGGDMEMPEAACDDCGPLRDRPASASAVAARGKRRARAWRLSWTKGLGRAAGTGSNLRAGRCHLADSLRLRGGDLRRPSSGGLLC